MGDVTAPELEARFGALSAEVKGLANHAQRVVAVMRPSIPVLERACHEIGRAASLHTDVDKPLEALTVIDQWALDHGENRAALVGSMFAIHQLRAHALRAEKLREAQLAAHQELRGKAMRAYYVSARADRTRWVAALLDRVMAQSCPELTRDDWVGLNVGALTDHEDVDLAIVARTEAARATIAQGFSLVSRTFVRFASKLQLFVSEHLESGAIAGTVEEYKKLVESPRSVVVVMQLLHAEYLAGSTELFDRFKRDVTRRFGPGARQRLAHEGFLRAVLAELISQRVQEPEPEVRGVSEDPAEVISPKREIYIPGKLVAAAMRVIHDVHETEPARALRDISKIDSTSRESAVQLARAFEENEALRGLVFAYVASEDRIDLRERSVREATHAITHLLGLDVSPRKSAEARLLSFYREIRARSRESIADLSGHVRRYLAQISSLRQLVVRGSELRKKRGANVAVRFVAALRRFRGAVFWDELVELLAGPSGEPGEAVPSDLFARFLVDLKEMGPARAELIDELVGMMVVEPTSAMEFLAFVARAAGGESELVGHMFEVLCGTLSREPEVRDRFAARVLDESSGAALYRLALACRPEQIGALARCFDAVDASPTDQRAARTVRSALILAHRHSNQVGRTMLRAVKRSPELFRHLRNPSELAMLERKIQALAAKDATGRAQMAMLGDAFDISVLRAVLGAILEGSPVEQDVPFIESFEVYARELFKACYREVHARSSMFALYRPGAGVALFATGGFGRGHAFGADWDYFALVDERDEGLRKFLGKIVQLVEGELARRGVMPHNRLSDTFRSYAVTIPELHAYLRARTSETFVDEAEILESRFLLGDRILKRRFEAEVVHRVCADNGGPFVRDVCSEIRGRRSERLPALDLKLTPGGLRDIHLIGLAVSVHSGRQTGVHALAFPEAIQRDMRFLAVAEAEIRRVRDLYRLLVAGEDYIDLEALPRLFLDLPSIGQAGTAVGDEIHKLLHTSAERIERVMVFLETHPMRAG
ncbi:MAG: hypothetical protein HY791_23055 [Deltaproteobacteria bacterium]|nr:hypothetical protein [Deltaproteobacteria bacterium]